MQRAESEYWRDKQDNKGRASKEKTFNYAFYLVQSERAEEQRQGVHLLETGLLTSDPLCLEYLYYHAVGCHKLGEYQRAVESLETMLTVQPQHPQAAKLLALVREDMRTDALIGGGVVVGGLAALAGGIFLLGKALANRKK